MYMLPTERLKLCMPCADPTLSQWTWQLVRSYTKCRQSNMQNVGNSDLHSYLAALSESDSFSENLWFNPTRLIPTTIVSDTTKR